MPVPNSSASWMTARRLRAHGVILAVCSWSVFVWNVTAPGLRDRAGTLKGADFLHLYTVGSLALAHRGADLYNVQAQAELAAQRAPAASGIRFLPLYPPQVSLLFAPLASLSYTSALVIWLSLSALIYGSCVFAVWRVCPHVRSNAATVAIAAIAFPSFWNLMAWGQTSALALACFTAAFFALRSNRDFLAGVALGCLIFKPQLALAAMVVFLITAHWKLISGMILGAALQVAAAVAYYRMGPLHAWLAMLLRVPKLLPIFEPRLYQTHSLRTFWSLLIPWPRVSLTLYVLCALAVLWLAARCWRSALPLSLRFSALLLASVLVAPHLTVYDLVILAPAFLLTADWSAAHSAESDETKILLYLTYILPLLAPVTRWIHLQASVPIMFLLLISICRIAGRTGRSAPLVTSASLG